jgi:hypothetical protein
LIPETAPNPFAGKEHVFHAWRLQDASVEPVMMRDNISDGKIDDGKQG